jgi:hypothetical protein
MIINDTGVRSENISGESGGYRYELMQVVGNNMFAYKITTPSGVAKILTLDAEAVRVMVANPAAMWIGNISLN